MGVSNQYGCESFSSGLIKMAVVLETVLFFFSESILMSVLKKLTAILPAVIPSLLLADVVIFIVSPCTAY